MGNSVIYEYDGFNRLTNVSEGINKAEYKYNSSGLRTSKTVNGEKTDFILDGIYVIAEIKDGDVTNYIRGLCGIIYSKDKKGTKTYYVTNNHGDVTALVNSSGIITKEYTYDEYGVEANPDKEDTNPFRYCGEYYDTETGFIYLRARYYDPELGRFISEDPARANYNWYVYCNANPIIFVDPKGLVEVLLSYIIEKNGGKVEYIKEKIGPNQKEVGLVEVTLGKKTKTYIIGSAGQSYPVREVNGKSIVDNSVLMRDFGLSERDSVHNAKEDCFDTKEHAVLAWALKYNPSSISEGAEYAGSIFQSKSTKKFSFTTGIKGKKDGSVPSYPDPGYKLVGVIHTHGANDKNYLNEDFSIDDRRLAINNKVSVYLVTPSGQIKEYKNKDKTDYERVIAKI